MEGESESYKENAMSAVNPGRSILEGSIVRKSGIEQRLRQITRFRRRQQRLPWLNPRPLNKPRLLKRPVLLCGGSSEECEPEWATR